MRFDHFERVSEGRNLAALRTFPTLSRPSINLTTNQFVYFVLTLYKQEWLLDPLCTPTHTSITISPLPPSPPSPLSPPLSCGNPVRSCGLYGSPPVVCGGMTVRLGPFGSRPYSAQSATRAAHTRAHSRAQCKKIALRRCLPSLVWSVSASIGLA